MILAHEGLNRKGELPESERKSLTDDNTALDSLSSSIRRPAVAFNLHNSMKKSRQAEKENEKCSCG